MSNPGDFAGDATDIDVTEIDVDTEEGMDDDLLPPTRSSVLEPGPLSIAGLSLGVISFLTFTPLDDALEANLDATASHRNFFDALAKRESVAHLAMAAVALLICLGSAYLDDATDKPWARNTARAGILVAAASILLHAITLGLAASG